MKSIAVSEVSLVSPLYDFNALFLAILSTLFFKEKRKKAVCGRCDGDRCSSPDNGKSPLKGGFFYFS